MQRQTKSPFRWISRILILCILTLSVNCDSTTTDPPEPEPNGISVQIAHHGQPVLKRGTEGQWDSRYVVYPSIIADGDTLRMWYVGGDGNPAEGGCVGYAWSKDGVNWNKYAGNPLFCPMVRGRLINSHVVIEEEGYFSMWFVRENIIFHATSPNGLVWIETEGSALRPGISGEWDCCNLNPRTVLRENGQYLMWYSASDESDPLSSTFQVGLAVSPNGLNWTKFDEPSTPGESDPVIRVGSSGHWDDLRVTNPTVVHAAEDYYMIYSGLGPPGGVITSSPPVDSWLGFATSSDGTHWSKWSQNPIYSEPPWAPTNPDWGTQQVAGTLLHFGDEYHLWYALWYNDRPNSPQIGYAKLDISVPN